MSRSAPAIWAVVPATGVGARMQAGLPKQYLELRGRSILAITLDRLLDHPLIEGAVVVLAATDIHWARLGYTASKPLLVCQGGRERVHSVFNGLQRLATHADGDPLVLIHDAVRPCVAHDDLDQLIEAAVTDDGGAILGAPVADTIKLADDAGRIARTRSRQGLWRAFTPQAFRLSLIQNALDTVIERGLPVTDDASAMEVMGYRPRLVAGDQRNIKITHPGDLALAGLLLDSLGQANSA